MPRCSKDGTEKWKIERKFPKEILVFKINKTDSISLLNKTVLELRIKNDLDLNEKV